MRIDISGWKRNVSPLGGALLGVLLSGGVLHGAEVPLGIPGDEKIDVLIPGLQVPRDGEALAYDSRRHLTVLFGGTATYEAESGETFFPETMEWDGHYWRGTAVTQEPPVDSGFAMAYDIARGQVVLFGGGYYSSETWTYDGTNWTKRSSVTSPPGRVGHAMAYDSQRRQVLMFGGNILATPANTYPDNVLANDLWAWDGTNWQERAVALRPSVRLWPTMAYDSARDRVVMFGGVHTKANYLGIPSLSGISETWEWNGSNWANVTPTNITAPYTINGPGISLAYDSQRGVSVLYMGGSSDWGTKTYEWNGTSWATRTNTLPSFANNTCGPLAYDSARQRMVLYKDANATYESDGTTNWWISGGFASDISSDSHEGVLLWTDMNGDRLPDVVVGGVMPNATGSGYINAVAVYTNEGGWRLSAAPAWVVPAGGAGNVPQCAAAGDVNGDGHLDLAIGFGNGSVLLFTNTGTVYATNPCWRSSETYCAQDLAWVDVDNDGDLDLTVTHSYSYYITNLLSGVYFYQNQNGALASNATTAVTLANSANDDAPALLYHGYSAWADLDGNGSKDLAVSLVYNGIYGAEYASTSAPSISTYRNTKGVFTPDQTISNTTGPVALGDINGDSAPDLVCASGVLLNQDGRLATTPASGFSVGSGSLPLAQLGDVDGDGDLDIFFGADGLSSASVHRNDGGVPAFDPSWTTEWISDTATWLTPAHADPVDFNGDGILDVGLWNGVCLMTPVLRDPISLPMSPKYLTVRSGTPHLDDITVSWDPVISPDLAGYRIYGKNAFELDMTPLPLIGEAPASATNYVLTSAPPGIWSLGIRAVDKAGRESLETRARIASLLSYTNCNDGAPDFSLSSQSTLIDTIDVDTDGDLDLFVENNHPHPTETRTSWTFWKNDGHGQFTPGWTRRESEDPAYSYGPGRAKPVSLGDVNGDGLPDLLALTTAQAVGTNGLFETRVALEVYLNTNGGFAPVSCCTSVWASGATPSWPNWETVWRGPPQSYAWGDANGDGFLDLAVAMAGSSNNQAALFLNNGGLLGQTSVWTSAQTNLLTVAFGDLNHDGKADLALCQEVAGDRLATYVYTGQADGLSEAPVWSHATSADSTPWKLSWADYNNDGYQDLTVFGKELNPTQGGKAWFDHRTFIYQNQAGTLAATPNQIIDSMAGYTDPSGFGGSGMGNFIGWADMDDDGDLDLVGTRSVLENVYPAAGPIGPVGPTWHGYTDANQDTTSLFFDRRWFYDRVNWTIHDAPPVCMAKDFNGDGTPDVLAGDGTPDVSEGGDGYTVAFRKPHSIVQDSYTSDPDRYATNISISPGGPITLNGAGASQAFTITANGVDVTPKTKLDVTMGLGYALDPDAPVVSVSNNVVTAVGNGQIVVTPAGILTGSSLVRGSVVVSVVGIPDAAHRLTVTPGTLALTRLGETAVLTVTKQTPPAGDIVDVSPDAAISVSPAGIIALNGTSVTALSNGSANVVAQYGGLSATAVVTVAISYDLTGLSIRPNPATVAVGGYQGFEVSAHFSDGTRMPVTYLCALTSSASSVAAVDGAGVVGEAAGHACVTASFMGRNAQAGILVTGAPPPPSTNAPPPVLDIYETRLCATNSDLVWYSGGIVGMNPRFTTYQTTNLLGGVWTPVSSNILRSFSGFNSNSIPIGASQANAFYKIGLDTE